MGNEVIEKKILLKAPRSRVWRAIANAREFGSWFGMELEGEFRAGHKIVGKISPTTVDDEIAEMQRPHAGKAVEFWVDCIEPEKRFCIKWHPFAIDPSADYSQESMTLISFLLEDNANGVLLTICETGFDKLPSSRRVAAFNANDQGWAMQIKLIEKYIATAA